MWYYILIGVAVAAVIAGFVYNFLRSRKINQNGVEVDAVVSRIKENEGEDADGNRSVDYVYYVKYQTPEGQTVEAKLGNPPAFLTVGKQLRVKYLPEKPKFALVVKN